MSSPPINSLQGIGLFTGFTRLCKSIAAVLIASHVVVQIFPSSVSYLALIPARTIPFAWNLISAGFVERTLYGVVVSSLCLLFMGKLIEPVWGKRELFKFIFIVNFITSICVFITAIALYYTTRQETYLYMPISGFQGVLSGLFVAMKQLLPDQELSFLSIKAKWLPSLTLSLAIVVSFFTPNSATYLPSLIFGTYVSWIYLRYIQKKPETKTRGDMGDDFAFSTFFPEFVRPVVDQIALVFDRVFCRRNGTSSEPDLYNLDGAPLPGSHPIEASRRRERGARALEERLGGDRLAAGKSAKEEHKEDAMENV